ncbi:MAG: thrombospondin type 3 repeat-containing protein [Verrucomicrobia bacterium]|nr:thrombospondin type 3 repeat-containing protein [Verrucomicrobiota bacterium]
MKTEPEVSPAKPEGKTMPPANSAMPAIASAGVPRSCKRVCSTLSRQRGTVPAALVPWRSLAPAKEQPRLRRHLFCLLALGSSLFASFGGSFVYENAWELQSDGDFNGDSLRDLLIVDKATGSYRVGYQVTPGVYAWASARASGIANATGLGIGKLDSLVFDSLALTGPDANRVNILDAANTTLAGQPVSVFIPSLGPNSVAAIDIGGGGNTAHDDLCVASLYNGLPAFRETLLRNDGTTNRTLLSDSSINYLRERANPVLLHTNRYPRLAMFQRNVGVNYDYFSFFDLSGGSALNIFNIATAQTPKPYEYVTGQFDSATPYTEFLFYPPGGWYFYEYQVTEPSSNNYAVVYTNVFTLTNFIDRLFVLPGVTDTKLLVFDTNGVSAAVYNFDGRNPPVVAQAFAAAPGEHFTGAGVLGANGFMAYSAPLGQNTSAKFRQWKWNGLSYSNSASGDLPRISTYSASGNVMQFQHEPFVTNNPVLLRLNSAGDWASSLVFSGLPGNISVQTETFLTSTQGLVNPTLTTLGAAHPLAAFGLANQYSNMISLFSFTPPAGDKISDVTISPLPGIYPGSIKLQFAAANPSDSIFFRQGGGAWTTWSNSLSAIVFTNTTVQYYGQPSSGVGKSAVKSATYSFTQGPATLDSKGDGIPDYVKIARGLSLTGSRDSDGDGYSDLEELIHGTDPLSNSSVPTNYPHLDDQAAFDLNVTPRPWDGFSNAITLCATGAVLHAYDFQGALLGSGATDTNHWPVAPITNISIVVEDRLVSVTTDPHYYILTTNTDTKVGREMLGLAAVPAPQFPAVPYIYGGGNITNEALNWIAAASNVFNHLPRATLAQTLNNNSTLEALLFELRVAQLLAARSNAWWTNITLFPSRVADAGRTNPPQSLLLSLESAATNQPGYKLQTAFGLISNLVETSVSPPIASLRAVVQDIYRIDSLLNNTNPSRFVLPVDEIRYFLWQGTLDPDYLAWATTSNQFAAATTGAASILAAVSGRPTTNVFLVVRNDTLTGPCRILDLLAGGVTFALQDASSLPFNFPNNFQLLPGTVVQVSGYTDVTNSSCAYQALEATSVLLNSVPIATDTDASGNLLIDSWENRFFGAVGVADPFGDADGDGYQNIQEMLEGTDPLDPYGHPTVPIAHFAPPVLDLVPNGSQVELHFLWPASYVNRFNFGVRHSPALSTPFTDLPIAAPVGVAGYEFQITFTVPATSQHFYFLTIALR